MESVQSLAWRGDQSLLPRLWLKNPRTASWLSTHRGQQREESLSPLLIKITDSTHIVSLSLWKHTFTPAVSFCWAIQQICKAPESDVWESTRFPEHFYPQWYPAHNKSITNPLDNCIWTVCQGCMVQTDACGKCWWRFLLLCADCRICFTVWSLFVVI